MIVHIAEVWLLLAAFLIAGCLTGTVLYRLRMRQGAAHELTAIAPAGTMTAAGNMRAALQPPPMAARLPAPHYPDDIPDEGDMQPLPVWDVVEDAVAKATEEIPIAAASDDDALDAAADDEFEADDFGAIDADVGADDGDIETERDDFELDAAQANDLGDFAGDEVEFEEDVAEHVSVPVADEPEEPATAHPPQRDGYEVEAVVAEPPAPPGPVAGPDDDDDVTGWTGPYQRLSPIPPDRAGDPPEPAADLEPSPRRQSDRSPRALPAGLAAAPAPDVRKPVTLEAPRNGVPDNLQRIRGIGERNELRLNRLGIFHFSQIAAWTPAEARWVGEQLAFPDRIERDDWIGQAIVLASGGETGFTKSAERRRVRRRTEREDQGLAPDDPMEPG